MARPGRARKEWNDRLNIKLPRIVRRAVNHIGILTKIISPNGSDCSSGTRRFS
jgi:hypothetical protein